MTLNEDETMTTDQLPGLGGQYDPALHVADWPISDLFAAAGLPPAAAFPASFRVGTMPSVLNQGTTPQCVAFSGSAIKGHEDRLDQGEFFNFDEAKFFGEIGGGPNGAYISNALARVKNYGYPVVSVGQEGQHKAAAYYSVPLTVADLKAAITAFGPLWCIGEWKNSWFRPGANGVLPAPSTVAGGHATVMYGWDDALGGFRFRNSWGAGWGASGDFILPYKYLTAAANGGYLWGAWKLTDAIEYSPRTLACGAQIRPDAHFGASLGTIAVGAHIGVSGKVAGSTWSKTSSCNPSVPNSGTSWYVVRTIGGVAVSVRFPGHAAVYVYAGAIQGG